MAPEHVASIRVDVFRLGDKYTAQAQPVDGPLYTRPIRTSDTPLNAAMFALQDHFAHAETLDREGPQR